MTKRPFVRCLVRLLKLGGASAVTAAATLLLSSLVGWSDFSCYEDQVQFAVCPVEIDGVVVGTTPLT